MILEKSVPAMFVASGALMLGQINQEGWIAPVMQGGALLLLAGVLYVIFKEIAPRFIAQMKDLIAQIGTLQENRHKENAEFLSALAALKESHIDQMNAIHQAHLKEMQRASDSHERIIKDLAEAIKNNKRR